MDVSIAIGKYINSLSQFSVVLTLEEKVKHHKRKNNYLDSSGGKKKKKKVLSVMGLDTKLITQIQM